MDEKLVKEVIEKVHYAEDGTLWIIGKKATLGFGELGLLGAETAYIRIFDNQKAKDIAFFFDNEERREEQLSAIMRWVTDI